MSLLGRNRIPLVPTRRTNYIPDQTEIVSVVDGQDRVVTPEEVKEFLPVSHGDYDVTIDRLIDSVTRQVESYLRRDLIKKNVRSYWERMPRKAELSRGPHVSVDTVTLIDSDGDERTLEEGIDYDVRGMKYKSLHNLREHGELRVEYVSGLDKAKWPPEVPGAILQEISLQFKNRQDPDTPAMTSVNNLSLEARHLLAPLRRIAF